MWKTPYCTGYVERALKEIEEFRYCCSVLQMNPDNPAEHKKIMKAFCAIGQFGTIRLARKFPEVKNEKDFLLLYRIGLRFYWMVLDCWDEILAQEKTKTVRNRYAEYAEKTRRIMAVNS